MDTFSLVERIKPLIPRTEEEASILALTLGALYATVLAEKYGYSVRRSEGGKDLVKEVVAVAANIVHDKVVPFNPKTSEEKNWLAGFYFNDALVRTDVAFEWIARCVTGIPSNERRRIGKDKMSKRALQCGFPQAFLDYWKIMSDEIDTFKHHNQFDRDRMDYDIFIKALEGLVNALEWYFVHCAPSGKLL
jgi:hypothetical protein